MLNILITSDSNDETGVADANFSLADAAFYKFMENQNYGSSLNGIAVFFMCRSPHIVFKRRIMFKKQSEKLYMDIMLDYNLFVNLTHDERVTELCTELCRELLSEIPLVVQKYKFKDFDLEKFMTNLKTWFIQNNYIN